MDAIDLLQAHQESVERRLRQWSARIEDLQEVEPFGLQDCYRMLAILGAAVRQLDQDIRHADVHFHAGVHGAVDFRMHLRATRQRYLDMHARWQDTVRRRLETSSEADE